MLEQSIFIDALDIDNPADRQAYLDQVCAGDSRLRAQIDELIKAHERTGHFMANPAPVLVADEFTICEGPGTLIGPYKLLEKIGEGGFGVVFMAEQQKPVRRKVALKVIKVGMDTRQVVARFEAERQALALMDHPNIAKVLDAGATETGRPYFVMELIKGLPITEYCDQSQLTIPERLQLFISVCQAVQHAHQKGIIHRDIKPTNVLVTLHDGVPVVKVIDFGIAKATGEQLTEKTLFTNFAQMIGTPLYMSPEQAALSGLDVDTRSDIYSLGVLLYELLTGTTPFEKVRLRRAAYDEMRRIIREEEPPKPSTRVSTLAQASTVTFAHRKSDPKTLSKLIRGDIDWIVMKSLEKDRTRRYETTAAFAADIKCYLNDQPIAARPPSTVYRFKKFARRNPRALTFAVMAIVGLLLAGIGLWNHQRQRDAIEAAIAQDLQEAERTQQQEQWSNAAKILERAKTRLEGAGLPALEAQVDQRRRDVNFVAKLDEIRLNAVHGTLNGRGDNTKSLTALEKLFSDHGLSLSENDIAETARQVRASPIATKIIDALDFWSFVKDTKAPGTGTTFRALARAADDDPWRNEVRDQFAAKKQNSLERLAKGDDVLAQPPGSLLMLSSMLGPSRQSFLRRAQVRYPTDFWITMSLADIYKTPDQIHYLKLAIVLKSDDARLYHLLGLWSEYQKNFAEAEVAYNRAIQLDPTNVETYCFLARTYSEQKRYSEAANAYQKALKVKPDDLTAQAALGDALFRDRRLDEAIAAYNQALTIPDHAEGHYKTHYNLGLVYSSQNKLDDAYREYSAALAARPDSPETLCMLGMVVQDLGKFAEGLSLIKRGHELGLKNKKWPHPSAKWLKSAEENAAAESSVTMILNGERQPKDNDERIELADFCSLPSKRYYAAATRFYREAFASEPELMDDVESCLRYNAACAAVLATCGRSKEPPLPDAQKAHLRGEALAWLRAELVAWQWQFAISPKESRNSVHKRMSHWLNDRDLESVCGHDAIANLPDPERSGWTRFWDDVAALEKYTSGAK
jgi:serine/threonine protein kinase/tetratricopeptide (TPR) repeat protein